MKMGEVVVSSDEVIEVVFEKEPDKDKNCKKNEDKDGSSEVVRWEKFLPRMMLRVLLVEADDSTRQIIAALLRKCSYRGQLPMASVSCLFVLAYMWSFSYTMVLAKSCFSVRLGSYALYFLVICYKLHFMVLQ